MGQEIVYCVQCASRLTGADFEKGKAVRIGHNVACAKCAPSVAASLPPEERPSASPLQSTTRIQAARARPAPVEGLRPGSSTRIRTQPDAPAERKLWVPFAVLGGVAILGGILWVFLSGPSRSKAPPPAPPDAVRAVKRVEPKEDPRAAEARKAIEEARALGKARPDDVDALHDAWERAVRQADGTPEHRDAAAALDAIRARRRDAWAKDLARMEQEAGTFLGREEFQSAIGRFEAARALHPGSEWNSRIDGRIRDVLKTAEQSFEALSPRISAGLAPDELKNLRRQVARWGLPKYAAEFEKRAGPAPPPPPPVSAEARAYLQRWKAVMPKVAGREFDAAAQDLVAAGREATEDAVRREAAADAEDIRKLAGLASEAWASLARAARGARISIEYFDDSGERKQAAGGIVRADPARLAVKDGEGVAWVELVAVAASSLAAELGKRSESDRRLLAILCLAEGDRAGAERLLDGAPDRVPDKHWQYGQEAKVPKPPAREIEARALFRAAEAEFESMETLAGAVAKAKTLLADFGDTRVVRGDRPYLVERSEAGREYILLAHRLKGEGTFAPATHPKIETAWTSKSDSAPEQAIHNFVEAEFAALSDTVYRCWALVGGCCAETFTFLLQTTEGSDVHPRTRQKVSIDPGAGFAVAVKHSITGLRKDHAIHAKKEPKAPARWEWVPVPLPKYAAPGAKKIRLLTDQQGFSVACVLVSSQRALALTEAELKKEAAKAKPARAALEEGLLGWWMMDDGSGAVVADAVEPGHPGAVRGAAAWIEGVRGGAIQFKGAQDVWIDGPFPVKHLTVSAWVRHDGFTGRVERYFTLGDEVAVLRHESLPGALGFYIKTDGKLRHLLVQNVLEKGKWFHAAGTWDGTTARLYKDGVEIASATPGGELSGNPNRILLGSNVEALHGALDDVRLYPRALTAEEVRRRFAEGPQAAAAPAVPEKAGGKPWRPIFDGKTLEFMNAQSHPGWKVEGGALIYIPEQDSAAQTRDQFSDGEFRIRFEMSGLSTLYFSVRQGAEGVYTAQFDGARLSSMDAKPHELILICRGSSVTAALDGGPVAVETRGTPPRGCLQFNAKGKALKILSIEFRE